MATKNIKALGNAQALGWTDAPLSRLAANSVGLGARLSITAPANASALSSTGYSLTGSNASSMIDLAGTWDTTGTPTLIKANVTNTASNAASLLMDLQVGGVSRAKVHVDGRLIVTSTNSFVDMAFSPLSAANVGIKGDSYNVKLVSNASTMAGWDLSAFYIGSNQDVYLLRDAANTLALRNSTNAQAFNIYNTYSSGSVYERGFMRWVSNVLEIGTEHVGASARGLSFKIGSTAAITIGTAGTISLLQECYANLGGNNVVEINQLGIGVNSAGYFAFSSTTNSGAGKDAGIKRTIAGVVGVTNGSTGGGALGLIEMTSPAAPATNGVYIFAEDNGGGKTRLMARFATGATQQLAIEP